MNARRVLVPIVLLVAALSVRGADAPKTPAEAPQVLAAVQLFSSESFAERQQASTAVQQALAAQMQALLRVDDPEAKARMDSLLEFNEGLAHWARDTQALPRDQQEAQWKWCLKPEVCPILARVYARRHEIRAAAVRELDKIPDPEASLLLARLIKDESRAVSLAAMEVVWDRPTTPAIVEALWDRAIEWNSAQLRGEWPGLPNVFFRGRNMGADPADRYRAEIPFQDREIATEVLIQLKSPEVTAKLAALLDRMVKDPNNPIYQPASPPIKNAYRIIAATKPRTVVPTLMKLVAAKPVPSQFGNPRMFWTNRTETLALIVQVLGLDLSEYRLTKTVEMGGAWVFPTEQDETTALATLQTWWKDHGDKYLAGAAEVPPSASAPATTPAKTAP